VRFIPSDFIGDLPEGLLKLSPLDDRESDLDGMPGAHSAVMYRSYTYV
jgi:hypothetical protein